MENNMESRNILKVQYGSIYTMDNTMLIDNMAIIFSVDTGIYKYGEAMQVEQTFEETMLKLRKSGLDDFANTFILIKFDRYEGLLTTEEVCTFINYMLLVSANSEKNLKMLNMEIEDLKTEIKKLQDLGF